MFDRGERIKKWIVVFFVLLSGCATWQPTGGPYIVAGYSVDLPQGWMVYSHDKNMFVTKDGQALQNIFASMMDITEYDEEVRKRVIKGMLPQEAAQVVIDKLKADKRLGQLTIVENGPSELGGGDGFRLVYTYRANDVRYKCIFYGMLQGEIFYRISYDAPVRYYFDKDVTEFEQLVKTFKLASDKKEVTN